MTAYIYPLFLFVALSFFSCHSRGKNNCLNDEKQNLKNDSLILLIEQNPYIHCGKNWRNFDEPSIFDKDCSFFRLSFKSPESLNNTMLKIYRIEKKNGQAFFEFKLYSIKDAKPDSLLRHIHKSIKEKDFVKVKLMFITECFWDKPVDMDYGKQMLDGTTFVIEASCSEANNRSHLVFSFGSDTSFIKLMDVISDFEN